MIDEVDKRLDMSLSFSFPIESYVLSTIVKEKPVPINVYHQKSEQYITFFLHGVSANDRMMLETLNPVKMGDSLVITEKITNPLVKRIADNVGLVSTLADGELFTHGKIVFASFRFHSSEMKGAAELLRKVVSLDVNLSGLGLSESKGLVEILNEIDKRLPLSLVTFSFKEHSDTKFVLEWRNLHQPPLNFIKYNLDGDISATNLTQSNGQTSAFLTAVDKDHIPLGTYLEYHNKERVQAYVYVPRMLVKPLLVRLYETTEKVKDFRLEGIKNYKDENKNP